MNLLKLFKSIFTQPQDPTPPSVVNYEEGEQPSSGTTPMDDAFRVHTNGLGATGSGKTFDLSRFSYDSNDIEEQINQAAKEMREAQERFHALVAELLSYQSTDAEIVAKTFPQYFKENNHE